ncbi:hypothetical protein ACHQM5_000752 [Ranunculus cassubicifolius]
MLTSGSNNGHYREAFPGGGNPGSTTCTQRRRELLYQSLCVMPLRLVERVLPWLVQLLSEEEAISFL